ncbi:MAG TPA: APC family permease [Micromonosporaceae bacterium]|jgi:amino acid transporter|nr:APC family permease [Micromonosporaceae bacterium]
MTISARLGAAIAAGVPVLVLVSMGPVAVLAGPPSVLVWLVSALVGLLMALMFAELAGAHPKVNGGVAVLAATVLRPRSQVLARVSQWSYWLGWSPALAINGLLVGSYAQRLLLPGAPAWSAVLLATAVLTGSVAVNHLGMRVGGRMQVVLVGCVAATVAALFAGALVRGEFEVGNFVPFAPPAGWSSVDGWLAVAGCLFMAGWSAYGAELALAYATQYRSGVRDAVRVTAVVGVASVVAFAVVPFLLLATVGVGGVRQDPADAFHDLAARSTAGASTVVLAVLTLALLLGMNMIAIASSWTLHQMAGGGDAWSRLGRLNRHGMPGNALRFDLAVNVGLLVAITALSRGNTAAVPIALLAAANVGYFVSMSAAVYAAWLNHRNTAVRGVLRLRPGLWRLAPAIMCFNLVLLATAGYAWGWRNVAIGAAVLATAIAIATWRRGRAAPPEPVAVLPACWGKAGAGVSGEPFPLEAPLRDGGT